MKILSKVSLGFMLLILLMVAYGAFTLVLVKNISTDIGDLGAAEDQLLRAKDIQWLDEVLTQSTRNYIYTANPLWKERYDTYGARLDAVIKEAIAQAETESTRQLFRRQDEANLVLVDLELRAHQLVGEQKTDEALAIIDGADYARWKEVYAETVTAYLDDSARVFQLLRDNLSVRYSIQTLQVSVILIAASIIIAALAAWLIGRSISKNIKEFVTAASRISKGDLTVKIGKYSGTEFEELANSFDRMTASIKILMEDDRPDKNNKTSV